MIFEHFEKLCPEVGSKERYVLTVPRITSEGKTPCAFGIFEFYCPIPGCDCRRVKIKFIDVDSEPGTPPAASILYGWERMRFYRGLVDDPKFNTSLVKGMLAPDEEQGPDCHQFLRFFQDLVKKEPLASHFPRHYRLFKQAARREVEAPSAKLFLPGRGDLVMEEPWAGGLQGGLADGPGILDFPPERDQNGIAGRRWESSVAKALEDGGGAEVHPQISKMITDGEPGP